MCSRCGNSVAPLVAGAFDWLGMPIICGACATMEDKADFLNATEMAIEDVEELGGDSSDLRAMLAQGEAAYEEMLAERSAEAEGWGL